MVEQSAPRPLREIDTINRLLNMRGVTGFSLTVHANGQEIRYASGDLADKDMTEKRKERTERE